MLQFDVTLLFLFKWKYFYEINVIKIHLFDPFGGIIDKIRH